MPRPSRALEQRVIRRGGAHCEYCHLPEAASELEFHCDHIIAEKHGGAPVEDNLAGACFSCNLRKGPNLSGLDPASGKLTRLFHPRTDRWTSILHGKGHGCAVKQPLVEQPSPCWISIIPMRWPCARLYPMRKSNFEPTIFTVGVLLPAVPAPPTREAGASLLPFIVD